MSPDPMGWSRDPSPSGTEHRRAGRVAAERARFAAPRVAGSVLTTVRMLLARRLHHPRDNVGRVIRFDDGSSARVYRETRVEDGRATDPAVVVVGFVLRGVRGRGHLLFRLESWLNIPLFVGFPGFTSKLWLGHDGLGRYRGLYEWDGAERAITYVESLAWLLDMVCVPGTVMAQVIPSTHRDDVLARRGEPSVDMDGERRWWLPVAPPEQG
ncbi:MULTISPECIES: hypothetical protein [unclassified Dietzia]|uniref:hypothetical protein n=1 Tax=unclassified Dietzia TaxID=2617939 RepID=UPI00131823EE|nr:MULTISPECIES: hypothetical protein [unclassified Dietzia]QGW23383.1 hypothetical protein GJR88_00502 [Dietzia sp. DQ12-45-1b]